MNFSFIIRLCANGWKEVVALSATKENKKNWVKSKTHWKKREKKNVNQQIDICWLFQNAISYKRKRKKEKKNVNNIYIICNNIQNIRHTLAWKFWPKNFELMPLLWLSIQWTVLFETCLTKDISSFLIILFFSSFEYVEIGTFVRRIFKIPKLEC